MSCCTNTPQEPKSTEELRDAIRDHYAARALAVTKGKAASCCSTDCCATDAEDPVTTNLYGEEQKSELPSDAIAASLGCGNPTLLAQLHPGEVVLDLGSGGGIDVLLSARRVAPGGKAIGLDMTDEMLDLARKNQREAGVENAEFLKGRIEEIPLPDGSVDVIVSNCVVNLSTDKDAVFRESFRVLKSGGRLAIADIASTGEIPEKIRRVIELWSGCIAGALDVDDYKARLARAGFADVSFEVTRRFGRETLEQYGGEKIADLISLPANAEFLSVFVRARKP